MNTSSDKGFRKPEALSRVEEASVRAFMHAAETLLGPDVEGTALSQDERDVIALYIQQITEKFPEQ